MGSAEGDPILTAQRREATQYNAKALIYLCLLLSGSAWLLTTSTRHHYQPSAAKTLKIASLNIRYDPSYTQEQLSDGLPGTERPWAERKAFVADQVFWESPDIIGFQEVLDNQLQSLEHLLGSEYDYIGVGRDDGHKAGEAVPIFYKRALFKRLGNAEHFWLSETPDVPGSISWDAGQTRMASVLHLQIKATKEVLHIVNTHFDDRGIVARARASGVILDRLSKLIAGDDLVLLVGDLNSEAHEGGYRVLTGHRYVKGHATAKHAFLDTHQEVSLQILDKSVPSLHAIYGHCKGTYSGFPAINESHDDTIIDFVMQADNKAARIWSVRQAAVLPNLFGRDTPRLSDHRMTLSVLQRLCD